MVNPEIPGSYTFSQSDATPHLTINHDVADDLGSNNAFEGPEKLLEVWFAPSPVALPPGAEPTGLKAVPTGNWVEMLDMVNCKILSVVHSETVDAYLLSESSMFVFPHKIILKTCGTTTLLLGLHRLLRIAAVDGGFPMHNTTSLDNVKAAATPYRIFYSRKNFLFPDQQRGPHRSWKQEVKYLDDMFEGGSAYMVGKMNGDHWYLYITSPSQTLTPPRTPPRMGQDHDHDHDQVLGEDQDGGQGLWATATATAATTITTTTTTTTTKIPTGLVSKLVPYAVATEEDETLEILMTDLDPENAKQFYLSHASAVACQQEPACAQGSGRSDQGRPGGVETQEGSGADPIFDVEDIANSGDGMKVAEAAAPAPGPDRVAADAMSGEAPTTEGHALGTVVSDGCGLSDIYPKSKYPDARIDAYMFAPCGFSANGVVPAPHGNGENSVAGAAHYFTVHVTPEPQCSFASFETNVPGGQKGRETADIVKHVVDIFGPGRFSVTLFQGKGRRARSADAFGQDAADVDDEPSVRRAQKHRVDRIPGYRRIDRIVHEFDDYDLVFRYYERDGWVGDSSARLGEDI